jgi:hypothetical protein
MLKKIEAVCMYYYNRNGYIIMPKGVYERVIKSPEERFWKYMDKEGRENENMSRCWRWCGRKTTNGYAQVWVNYKMIQAHRYSYALHNPYGITLDDMEGCDCCHECDNRECCNPDHLFLGERQDNVDDMCEKKRQVTLKGEQSGRAKLNQAQIIEIRNRYKNEQISQKKLGIEYGVVARTIGQIINNERWKHITTPDDDNQTEP